MADAAPDIRKELAGLEQRYREIEATNRALNERLLELYALYTISVSLANSLDLDKTLRAIRKVFKKSLEVDQFSLWLLDEESGELVMRTHFGFQKRRSKGGNDALPDIFTKTFRQGRMIYVSDVRKRAGKLRFHPGVDKKGGAFLCFPLRGSERKIIGVLALYRQRPNSFDRQEIKLFDRIARQIAMVIDRILVYEQTRALSMTDELTGVFNRRYFNQRYERESQRAKRYGRPLTVLMIDIDHFKNYNDVNGHLMGDDVLKQVAKLLESNIRRSDILARYGGEEFVILLPEISKEKARKAAEKLRQTVEQTRFAGEEKQPKGTVTISIGLATFPDDAEEPEALLDLADQALYAAKAASRNRVVAHERADSDDLKLPVSAEKAVAAQR
jgi:diguanylate cyclase (GGDEF)-like protein